MKKHFHIIFKGKSTKYINKKKERNIFIKHNIKKKRSIIRKEEIQREMSEESKPLIDETGQVNVKIEDEPKNEEKIVNTIVIKPYVPFLKLIWMSFFYLLVFIAFNGTQSIMTSLIGDMASYSLSILYISFTACSLLASTGLVIYLTPKWALVLGSIIYTAFIAANIDPMYATLMPLALFLGLAASIVWAAQGSYLTTVAISHAMSLGRSPRSSIGLFTGIFWGIFMLSVMVGNLISSLILAGDTESESLLSSSEGKEGFDGLSSKKKLLFYCYVAIACVGVLGLVFLPPPVPKGFVVDLSDGKNGDNKKNKKTTCQKIMGTITLFKEPKMALLIPFFLLSGFEQAFLYGDFTSGFVKVNHGVEKVGFVMCVLGVVDSLCSMIFGRLTNIVGLRFVGAFGIIGFSIFVITIGFFRFSTFAKSLPAAFMWAILLGASDSCLSNVFLNSTLGFLFSDSTEAAFSCFKTFQAGGTGILFFLAPFLTFDIKLITLAVLVVISSICVIVLDRKFQPLDMKASHAEHKDNVNRDDKYIQNK